MIEVQIRKELMGSEGKMILDLNLRVEKNELVALYGASGAGKTSTLRILSGLMRPDSGKIVVNEEVWFDSEQKINRKPQQRQLGLVFQDYALFPNMSVKQNLEFAATRAPSNHLEELLEIMDLHQLAHKRPLTLSGGQQQRVALARALAQRPKVLLLDEPLSALDQPTRWRLQDYLQEVHKKFQLTTIMVSHDSNEIEKLANTVFLLENGKLVATGKPNEILPATPHSVGKVIAIEQEKNRTLLTVDIQGQKIKIALPVSRADHIQLGQSISI
ncbi:MAG: ATP-binding cassette domain-containing protein [Bacteroidota bacterium]